MSELKSAVDFAYAFAAPHRLTVALPDSSDKTLLDLQPGHLRMAWTYDDLTRMPLAAFVTPRTEWELQLKPEIDGQPFAQSAWSRAEGWLPVLDNRYEDPRGSLRLEVAGGGTAAIVCIEICNSDNAPHRFCLRCEKPGQWAGVVPAWVDRSSDADVLLAGWRDRADRVLILALGAAEYPVTAPNVINLVWRLQPGETRRAWLVRPYRGYTADLPALRREDWAGHFAVAKQTWHTLIGRTARVAIPDPGVANALYACLADLFVMREPVADGYLAAVPGTEVYRAPNPVEPGIVAVALDQFGLHAEAAKGFQMCLDLQEPDGNWTEPKGWAHLFWAASGFKAWVAMEHYRLTGDRDYLASLYPRLLASSRWQERQRARTRVLENGQRPVTHGLMPRGMGDAVLKDDEDLYGVFLPHNIWAVYADKLSVQAAEILGKQDDLPELRRIYQTGLDDLLQACERGAIREQDYRWLPAVPGKTCGSRWGVLNAAFPCGLLPPDHELITGTIRKMEARLSPGGLPIHTGWMADGMWVAITLDNLAEVLLQRGEGDAAVKYLYATLNHGTPLYTWCEERGQQPGTKECSGDRQHLWTPVAVVRFIRDCLAMEEDGTLHLARGAAREWLAGGEPVGLRDGCTHFGALSFEMEYAPDKRRVSGFVRLQNSARVILHVRLPQGLKLTSVSPESGATVAGGGEVLEWRSLRGEARFEATVG